jgi:rhodanese-related sulfurtransferase
MIGEFPTPESTAAHYRGRLAFETDASDVKAAQDAGIPFTLVDTRSYAAWNQGRIPGAVHLPNSEFAERYGEIPRDRPVVVYCWSPGCNGGTKGALKFAEAGYQVKEMLGGFEYWAREGLGIEDDNGAIEQPADRLTTPVMVNAAGLSCAC